MANPVTMLTVDNDPARSAREIVDRFATQGVSYASAPSPGIAAARNKVLSETDPPRTLARAGRTIVWCDEAVVIDWVPNSRLTHQWVPKRAFRTDNPDSPTALALTANGTASPSPVESSASSSGEHHSAPPPAGHTRSGRPAG